MSKLSERTTHFPLLFSSLKVIDLGTPYPNLTVLTLSLPSGYSAVPSPCHPPLHSFPSCFTPLPHIHTHGQRRPCRKITLSLSERRGFFVLLQRTKGSFVYKKDFQLVLARGWEGFLPLSSWRERESVCVCVCETHTQRGKWTSALWEEQPDRTGGRQLQSRDRKLECFTVPSLSETAPGVWKTTAGSRIPLTTTQKIECKEVGGKKDVGRAIEMLPPSPWKPVKPWLLERLRWGEILDKE